MSYLPIINNCVFSFSLSLVSLRLSLSFSCYKLLLYGGYVSVSINMSSCQFSQVHKIVSVSFNFFILVN